MPYLHQNMCRFCYYTTFSLHSKSHINCQKQKIYNQNFGNQHKLKVNKLTNMKVVLLILNCLIIEIYQLLINDYQNMWIILTSILFLRNHQQ